MAQYPGFDQAKVNEAFAAVQAHNAAEGLSASASAIDPTAGGEYSVLAECISVTIADGQVCLSLPSPFGSVCIPIPGSFSGQAQACLSICSTFGVPHGVKVTVSVQGVVIVSKVFGFC